MCHVKRDFIDVRSLRDWTAVLDKWYSADGPGVWPDPRAADEVNGAGSTDSGESGEAVAQTCEA